MLPLRAQGANESKVESVREKVDTLQNQVEHVFDKLLEKSHFKIGGYLQPQYQHTEKAKGFTVNPYNPDEFIKDRFVLRRGRLKFKYVTDVVGFVLESDFTNKGVRITDAYLRITDPWTKYFSFKAGSFNRPFYEVEYSSSKRESPERSIVTRLLYPGERDLGFSFVIKLKDLFQLDLATYNNTYRTMYLQWLPNFKDYPFYYMIRLKKDFQLGNDAALSLGAHTRIGQMSANTKKVILPENDGNKIDSTTYKVGGGLSRTWYGVNAQFYSDWLFGLKIAAAYLWGNNVDQPAEDKSEPLRIRNFSGYYVYLIKNIGKEWQAVVKYNTYNPNIAIDPNTITSSHDLSKSALGFGIHNYSFSNIRLTLWYDIYTTQTNTLFPEDPVDNILTFRTQMKF
jgi:hypothetical protein